MATSQIPDKLFFKIGEVCELVEVQAHVLRYWESEFPMLQPQKNLGVDIPPSRSLAHNIAALQHVPDQATGRRVIRACRPNRQLAQLPNIVQRRAGERGTDVVAPLIEQAAARLKPGGTLLIEVSPMIATEVEQLVKIQPSLELGTTIRDLAGHPRIVQAVRRAK